MLPTCSVPVSAALLTRISAPSHDCVQPSAEPEWALASGPPAAVVPGAGPLIAVHSIPDSWISSKSCRAIRSPCLHAAGISTDAADQAQHGCYPQARTLGGR